jgi:DNA replication protein DnaD
MLVHGQWVWKTEFTVPNTTLISMLKFSRQQLDRMRNLLIQMGRIEYKKGKGNKAGIYKIISFDANNVTHSVTQTVTQTVTQSGQLCNIIGTLNNSNSNPNFNDDDYDAVRAGEEEPGDGETKKTPEQFYLEYFGRVPSVAEISQCILLLSNCDYELVEYAFFRACTTDNKNIAYVAGILQRLKKRNVRCMADLANDHMDRERGKA